MFVNSSSSHPSSNFDVTVLFFFCCTCVEEIFSCGEEKVCSQLTSWSATTSTPGNWSDWAHGKLARPLAEGSWGSSTHLPGPDAWRYQQQRQLSHWPSLSNQRRLSLTQWRAVNQTTPRRELGGGPLPGPKQRHTYICKRFQRHYYFERMIEWSW